MSTDEKLPRPGYEPKDADPRVPALLAGAMVAIVAVSLLAGLLIVGRPEHSATPSQNNEGLFQHGPEEKTDIERAWTSVDKESSPIPDGYAWIDRRAGIVRVPIDRAIDLVCAEQAGKTAKGATP